MVWPTWLSRLPAETTRAKAGSLLSSWSCCFHLVESGGDIFISHCKISFETWQVRWCHEIQTYFLSSDTSILVPNLMCFKGPLLLRATLKRHGQRKIKIGVYLSIIHLVAVHLKTPASMESSKNVRMLHKFIIQLNRLYPILEQK